jgi:hypothetical protein
MPYLTCLFRLFNAVPRPFQGKCAQLRIDSQIFGFRNRTTWVVAICNCAFRLASFPVGPWSTLFFFEEMTEVVVVRHYCRDGAVLSGRTTAMSEVLGRMIDRLSGITFSPVGKG